MAIVVPFLVSYGATAMGVAAATATTIATITSVAFQVTGINNKINKAASKVFGEDLVGIVNIAGAVYGAVNGGFSMGNAADATNASALGAVNGSDLASDVFSAANNAAGGGLVSDGLGGIYNPPSMGGNVIETLAQNGAGGAAEYVPDGGMNTVELNALKPDAGQGTNLLDPASGLGNDMKAMDVPRASSTTQTGATSQSAAGSTAAGLDAAANKATAGQQLGAGNVSQSAVTPPTVQKPPTTNTLGTKPGSFFDKLLSNDKAVGALIQGVGGGLQSASNNKAKQEELEFQKKLRNSVPTLYIKGAQA